MLAQPIKKQCNLNDTKTLDEFEIGEILGSGNYGHVYLAREKKTNSTFALKKITQTQTQTCLEVENQSRLCHPNILRVYDHFYDSDYLYILLELASGGDLYTKLQKDG